MGKSTVHCGTDYYNSTLYPKKAKKGLYLNNVDLNILAISSLNKELYIKEIKEYDIPIVCHVLQHTNEEIISNEQIVSQIKSLNDDFRNRNLNHPLFSIYTKERDSAMDSKINFHLTKKDQQGNATDGIIRTPTDKQSFVTIEGDSNSTPLERQPVKSTEKGGQDPWDTTKFLNIWICKLSDPGGYAQYPEEFTDEQKKTDGIVIDYTYFGIDGITKPPHNKGRTLTHEVGHWLGLYHLTGPGKGSGCSPEGDLVEDTPPQRNKQTKYPNGDSKRVKCPGCPDPFALNFMDFWDDDAKLMFTKDQVIRMRKYLEGFRGTIINQSIT